MGIPRLVSAHPRRSAAAAAALVLVAVAGVVAWSGHDPGGSVSPRVASAVLHGAAPSTARRSSLDSIQRAPDAAFAAAGSTTTASDSLGVQSVAGAANAPAYQSPNDDVTPQIISVGDVALRSTKVEDTRFAVQEVVDKYDGTITSDTSDADKSGTLERSRQVLRIPSTHFEAALDALRRVATLVDTSAHQQDVTTEVIDNAVRLKTQRESIDQIRKLLARAHTIREIIAIQSQLSDREATLDSLEQRQAYLADQTSMSTITVSVERISPTSAPTPKPAGHHRGFVSGLHSGWRTFGHGVVGVLTAAGAAVPFAVLVLVLAIPTWILLRRRRVTPAAPTVAAE